MEATCRLIPNRNRTPEMEGHRAAYRTLAIKLLTLVGRSDEEAKQDTDALMQVIPAAHRDESRKWNVSTHQNLY